MNVLRRWISVPATGVLLLALPPTATAATEEKVNWGTATTISASGSDGWWPRVVSSSDGSRMTTVWRQETLSGHVIGTSSSADGGSTWNAPADLGDGTGQPSVVGSDDGLRVSAMWYPFGDDRLRMASSGDGGQTWSPATDVGSPGAFNSNPSLSGSADGNRLTAVWVYVTGGKNVVQTSSSSNAGQTWSAPVDLSDISVEAVDPQVAMSADGTRVCAVYTQPDNGVNRIFARFSANGGTTWGAATPISDETHNASAPQVATSADGTRLTVVYAGEDAGKNRIQSATIVAGNSWTSPVFLSDAGQEASRPQLLSSADGLRLAATWQRGDGTNERVQSASSTDGAASWTSAFTHSPAGSDAEYPTITGSNDAGRVAVAWVRNDPGSENLIEAAFSGDGGSAWAPTQRLSADSRDAYDPAVASTSDGRRILAAWSRTDGTDYRIQVSVGTVPALPGPPRDVIATAGDGQVAAVWTPPSDDGYSAITSYTATATPGGGTCTSATTSCTIPGLVNGTAYTVTVTASNAVGTGPASAPSNPVTPIAVTPATPPVAPPAPPQAKSATTVIASAVAGRGKLKVRIKPDLGPTKQWKFVVQVKRGGWKTIKTKKGKTKVYATKGAKHTLTVNLSKGKYRAKSRAARGYAADTSKAVRLRK